MRLAGYSQSVASYMSRAPVVYDVNKAGRMREGGRYDAQWSSSVDGGRGRIGRSLSSDGVSRGERKGCVSPRTRERVQGAIGTSLASVWRCFGGVCAPCVERGELSARVPCQRVPVTKNAPMAAHLRASELQPVGKFE